MQKIDHKKIEEIKQRVRVTSENADMEVEGLIKTCIKELEMSGVYGDMEDSTYFQVIVLYCKANYGYDEKTERFQTAFEKLRDAMKLSGDYEKVIEDGN